MNLFRSLLKFNTYTLIIGVFAVYIVFQLGVTYSQPFSTTITVKEKSTYGTGKYMSNIVVDTHGTVYTVHPMYLVGDFDAIHIYASLEQGKTYHISGYGMSIPFLQMFPNITRVSPA